MLDLTKPLQTTNGKLVRLLDTLSIEVDGYQLSAHRVTGKWVNPITGEEVHYPAQGTGIENVPCVVIPGIKPWKWTGVPDVMRVRRKASGKMCRADFYPQIVRVYEDSELAVLAVTYEDFATDYELPDGGPCGTKE